MPLESGILITFEGGEGTGKSTQIKRLSAFLAAQNIPHQVTREPGGVPSAEVIRTLLLDSSYGWDPVTEALLMAASRREHLQQFILPVLQRGEWVLCDRFADSTWVYQGFAHGLGPDFVKQLHTLVMGDFAPHLTFVFKLSPKEGLLRKKAQLQEENRFEKMDFSFHERVEKGYEALLSQAPDRCISVDAMRSMEEISELIKAEIKKRYLL